MVGLWVHRPSELNERTGLGRYGVELSTALWAAGQADAGAPRYTILGGRERGPVAASVAAVPVGRSWPPRRALHLAWMMGRWPRFEQVGPAVDLVHVLYPSFPIATRAKLVGTIHDLFPIDHPEWFPRTDRRAVPRSIGALIEDADRLVCDSAFVRAQLLDRFALAPQRVRVVHPGVSNAWRQTPWGASTRRERGGRVAPYVIAVGKITHRKNLPVLLRAIAQLDGVALVLAGNAGPMSEPILAQVEELDLRDRVLITGRVSAAHLVDLVQGAEALVHPSLDEGFGFPPIEAMAAGTPAIVARSGSVPEIVGDAGLVLDVNDPDAWAGAIQTVLTDPHRRQSMVTAGRLRADAFTWERATAATLDLHREVLAEH